MDILLFNNSPIDQFSNSPIKTRIKIRKLIYQLTDKIIDHLPISQFNQSIDSQIINLFS